MVQKTILSGMRLMESRSLCHGPRGGGLAKEDPPERCVALQTLLDINLSSEQGFATAAVSAYEHAARLWTRMSACVKFEARAALKLFPGIIASPSRPKSVFLVCALHENLAMLCAEIKTRRNAAGVARVGIISPARTNRTPEPRRQSVKRPDLISDSTSPITDF